MSYVYGLQGVVHAWGEVGLGPAVSHMIDVERPQRWMGAMVEKGVIPSEREGDETTHFRVSGPCV